MSEHEAQEHVLQEAEAAVEHAEDAVAEAADTVAAAAQDAVDPAEASALHEIRQSLRNIESLLAALPTAAKDAVEHTDHVAAQVELAAEHAASVPVAAAEAVAEDGEELGEVIAPKSPAPPESTKKHPRRKAGRKHTARR